MSTPSNIANAFKENSHAARRMAAKLLRRYLAVLAAVSLLLVLDQAVIQPRLLQVGWYAPTINVAGRQRMLSQRISKAALRMRQASSGEDFRALQSELADALDQWTRAHDGLLDGDKSLGLPPASHAEIRARFAILAPHFRQVVAAASVLRQLEFSNVERARDTLHRQVAEILRHEGPYLETMDRIVGLYEWEARRRVQFLRTLGLAVSLGIILLIVALAWLVLRPANQRILWQVHKLEDQVAERTRQLTNSNRALKREIDEREEAERRTRQLSHQLAHASRVTAIGQLATGLAHEINQPLAAITNYAETCALLLERDGRDASHARDSLERIRQAALRAGQIVRRMRNFVRPRAAEADTKMVSLNELIGEVEALCRSEMIGADVTLQTDLTPALPMVAADPIRIQQVLVNLLQNATRAMQGTAPECRRLVIRTSLDDAGPRVEVVDNGPGFSEDNPEVAFAPFFTTHDEGLGMGLSISRSIVEEHGGKLWADNLPSGGAVVCFTLPGSRCDGADIQDAVHSLCR